MGGAEREMYQSEMMSCGVSRWRVVTYDDLKA